MPAASVVLEYQGRVSRSLVADPASLGEEIRRAVMAVPGLSSSARRVLLQQSVTAVVRSSTTSAGGATLTVKVDGSIRGLPGHRGPAVPGAKRPHRDREMF